LNTLQETFQKRVLADLKKIFDIECQLIKILESTDKLLTNKKVNKVKEHVHKQQHESQINTLAEREEQLKNSTVSKNKT